MSVELIKVEIEVTKGANDLAQGLMNLITVIKQQLDDGFQIGDDLPPVIAEAVKALPGLVNGVSNLKEEVGYDKGKVILAFVNALDKVL